MSSSTVWPLYHLIFSLTIVQPIALTNASSKNWFRFKLSSGNEDRKDHIVCFLGC